MKILILAAMNKELQLLSSLFDDKATEIIEGISLVCGKVGQHDVFLAQCGIGNVNAAVNAYKIVSTVHPDMVVNSGVAGGAGIPVGSVLVADRVAYYNVWCGPGTEYGQADGCPLFMIPSQQILDISKSIQTDSDLMFGLICTGDKFVSTPAEIAFIRSYFPDVKAVDMESAAIAQVCMMTGTPFGIVRVVSDTPGEGENISQYKNFWSEAPEKTFKVLKNIISNLS
jgi:adenosylhomocysteine nucleosidase